MYQNVIVEEVPENTYEKHKQVFYMTLENRQHLIFGLCGVVFGQCWEEIFLGEKMSTDVSMFVPMHLSLTSPINLDLPIHFIYICYKC